MNLSRLVFCQCDTLKHRIIRNYMCQSDTDIGIFHGEIFIQTITEVQSRYIIGI